MPYSQRVIGSEISGIFLYFIIQYTRLKIGIVNLTTGSNGNKTETPIYLFYYIILGIPIIVSYVFYIKLQTYVLVFDVALNGAGLTFIVIETILSIKAMINIKSNDKPI